MTNLLYKSIEYQAGYGDLCKLIESVTQAPMMKDCTADALILSSQGNQIAEVDEAISKVLDVFEKIYCNGEIVEEGTLGNYFAHNVNSMFYALKTFSNRSEARKRVLTLLLKFLAKTPQNSAKSVDNLLIAVKTFRQVITSLTEEIKKLTATPQDLEVVNEDVFNLLITNSTFEAALINLKQVDRVKYTSLKSDFRAILYQLSASSNFITRSFTYLTETLNREPFADSHIKVLGWIFEAI